MNYNDNCAVFKSVAFSSGAPRSYWAFTFCAYCVVGVPNYYCGSHELWVIAGGPQVPPKFLPLSTMRKSSFELLSKHMPVMLLRLKRCCTLVWVTKILARAISNFHAGRRYPTPWCIDFHLDQTWRSARCMENSSFNCEKFTCPVKCFWGNVTLHAS